MTAASCSRTLTAGGQVILKGTGKRRKGDGSHGSKSAPAARRRGAVSKEKAKHSDKLVLVIDDDGATRTLARKHLEIAGFRVEEAANGEEGIEAFDQHRPDIVLLDVMMPIIDGFETCNRIRTHPGGTTTPILMTTSLDDLGSIERAYERGATDFVTKPIKWPTLHHRVRYMIRQKEISDRLRESEARLVRAQRIARMGIWEWDIKRDQLTWSDSVFDILGIRPGSFSGRKNDFLKCLHRGDRSRVEQALTNAVRNRRPLSLHYRIITSRGDIHIIRQEAEVEADESGKAARIVGTVQDITRQHQAEDRIRYLAKYDAITSLPNRMQTRDHLANALERSRHNTRMLAVLSVGLDRFKRINDTLGHDAGDEVLRDSAARLEKCLKNLPGTKDRETQPFLARFGGDEFTIIVEQEEGSEKVEQAARHILETMAEPFHLGGQDLYITTSIGIAMNPVDGDTVDTLLKHAGVALRHAKAQGKNSHLFYTAPMNADSMRRFSLESKLQKAVENGELALHYQPKVDIHTGHLVGMEALVRWQHPDLGMVNPGEFIALAEESGLIVPIGQWVLREACTQNRLWQEEGLPPLEVSVNLSARQFWDEALARSIGEILVDSGMPPRCLELEITEGTFMQNAEETVETLSELKDMDIKLSVDDFGTGYSSLAYLQRFPLDTLKVDRSFVQGVCDNTDSAAIARTIITMARSLGLTVIAEGVETVEQLAFLRAEGCHQLQGYLASKPLAAEAFTKLLRSGAQLPLGKVKK